VAASITTTLLLNGAVLGLAALVLWQVSIALRDVSFVDSWWPAGMAVAALLTLARLKGGPHGLLLTLICTIWAARLGAYLFRRWRRQGPDQRYTSMIKDAQERRGWSFARASLLLVFLLQAPLQLLVSLPVQLGQIGDVSPLGPLALCGGALALFGLAFEALADGQLAAFKADPANRGLVMDRGLWRYSRHPNFFGEALVWWGLYGVAAETPAGAFSLPGPLLITFLLTRGSGAPTVEKSMAAKGEAYRRYVERTSGFIPLPPKRS
jgi:steroid 5-alpha reductase family enzyme